MVPGTPCPLSPLSQITKYPKSGGSGGLGFCVASGARVISEKIASRSG
jgi:hypothetical protein